jgi:hypothetical protein
MNVLCNAPTVLPISDFGDLAPLYEAREKMKGKEPFKIKICNADGELKDKR